MPRFWWQLPGPTEFVNRVAQRLREGENVVLRLPEQFPPGLLDGIRGQLEGEGGYWMRLSASQDSILPINQIYRTFVQDTAIGFIPTLSDLMEVERFAGRVIAITDLTEKNTPAWISFIKEYSHFCRSHSVLGRTVFCVELAGSVSTAAPAEDICLSVQSWANRVSSLDMLLYCSWLFQSRQMPAVLKRLAVEISARLANWDPRTAEILADLRIEEVLEPKEVLLEIARNRNWQELSTLRLSPTELWFKGIQDSFDGTLLTHPAFSACQSSDGYDHRIWSAQVAVIYPFIEERRRELLTQFSRLLRIPYETKFGIITDLRDLEISHIFMQLVSGTHSVPPGTTKVIKRLKHARDRLSHLETLNPSEIMFLTESRQ